MDNKDSTPYLYGIFKNILDMLRDRGHDEDRINKLTMDFEDFNAFYSDKIILFNIKKNNTISFIYISSTFNDFNKSEFSTIKNHINALKKNNKSLDDKIIKVIFVINKKIDNNIRNDIKTNIETSLPDIEIFNYKDFEYNPTSHSLCPKFTLLSKEESNDYFNNNPTVAKKDLVFIKKTDVVPKWFNAKTGDIFKILREDIHGKELVYKICI